MARKKTALATTHRRPPALRAASQGFAAAGLQQLVAQGLAPALDTPATVLRGDRDAIETKLVQLVGPHQRVLVIGRDTWPLSRSLSSTGCRVSVIETRHDVPVGSASFSERVIVADPDDLDLDVTLEGAQFDAVVLVQLLEHVRNPVKIVTALRNHLSADGCVLAVVANIMHGSIRLGFLTGQSPPGLLASGATSPAHWYDRASVQRTFERAGFVITQLERHTETFDSDIATLDGAPLPAEIIAGLMRDADAMTSAFVVVAHPFPLTSGVLLDMRVRQSAQDHDSLRQQVRELAQRAEGLEARCTELQRALDGASTKGPSLDTAWQRLAGERVDMEAIGRDLKRFQYEQLIHRVRTTVEARLPKGAVALVVSKGDERLLEFNGRTGWHFLRNEKGVYAGHHPVDSAAAIEALERMRAEGAEYLVFPQVARWWLDHYAVFREHLDRQYRVVSQDDRTGVIYSLEKPETRR